MRGSGEKSMFVTVIVTVLVVIGLLWLVVIMRHNNTPCDYPEMASRGVLRVGMLQAPLSYDVADDSIAGYDYELLQMMARYAGIEIAIYPEDNYLHSYKLLDNRTYDLLAFQTPVVSDRRESYLFSTPVSLNKQVLIQRIDSVEGAPIASQLDLKGCTLHLAQDEATRMCIENMAHEMGDGIYICQKYDVAPQQLIKMVADGAIDYAVCDAANAAIIAPLYNNVDCSVDITLTQFMSWSMRRESTVLCDSIDSWLSAVQQGAEYKELYTRYFGNKNYDKMCRVGSLDYIEKNDKDCNDE